VTRIAVVGARDHRALAQVWRRVHELPEGTTVVSGAADGVDSVAALAARQRGLRVVEYPAAWRGPDGSQDLGAGLRRNGDIVANSDAVEAFPWPECRGTWDTVHKARAAGVPVTVHEPDLDRQALLVFSARVDYAGAARLDITRGSGQGELAFAPSRELLDRALAARERAAELRKSASALSSRQLVLGEPPEEVAARGLRAASLLEQADQIEADAWAWYAPRFRAEMRISYGLMRGSTVWARLPAEARTLAEEAWQRGARPRPEAWRRLLTRGWVVLVCFCADPARCHRGILRTEILPALGAVDGGELRLAA
jgi:hypothetical protein